jgi:agmatine deiminase
MSRTQLTAPPARCTFRMPAEWEPHKATWLSWPHNPATWPDAFEPVPPIFAQMAAELSVGEEVHILVPSERVEHSARELIAQAVTRVPGARPDAVVLHRIPTNDSWMRDHGPIFVEETDLESGVCRQAALDWEYNAWGGKYPPFDLDNAVPRAIAREFQLPVYSPGMVLEGGSIDPNGAGCLLTTEACLLNPNRNPHLQRGEIEAALKGWLGVSKVLWLGDGIVGDDTDGHVDDITRFVSRDTIVTVVEPDPADENHEPLAENRARLALMTDAQGRPFRIVELPMPGPVYFEDRRLPASYANFYIGNEVVLVPVYRHANDGAALQILAELFPGRRVIGIDCTHLVWGLGAFHCVTQQQPAWPVA